MYDFKHISGLELTMKEKSDILILLNIYYENAQEVFEQIKSRDFLVIRNTDNVLGFVTSEQFPNDLGLIWYIGVICLDSQKSNILLLNIMRELVRRIKSFQGENLVWCITQFFNTERIFNSFFEKIDELAENIILNKVLLIKNYNYCFKSKIILSQQFTGVYKSDYNNNMFIQNAQVSSYKNLKNDERRILIGKVR